MRNSKYEAQYQWNLRNKEKVNEIQKKWKAKHAERLREYQRQYNKKYKKDHPEKIKMHRMLYRARKTTKLLEEFISVTSNDAKRYIPSKIRFEVLYRDQFTCQYCGRKAPEVKLHIDHRKPFSDGGEPTIDNLITACEDCNLGKNRYFNTLLQVN